MSRGRLLSFYCSGNVMRMPASYSPGVAVCLLSLHRGSAVLCETFNLAAGKCIDFDFAEVLFNEVRVVLKSAEASCSLLI